MTDNNVIRPPRTRIRLAVVLVAVLAAVGVLAMAGAQDSLVYYRTTSELMADPDLLGERVRLGGDVQPGSVRWTDDGVRFTLTDGTTSVPVIYPGRPSGVFTEGEDALVDGTLDSAGLFHGDEIMVKHSNTYQAPSGAGS